MFYLFMHVWGDIHGGWNDYKGAFRNLHEIKTFIDEHPDRDTRWSGEIVHSITLDCLMIDWNNYEKRLNG